jgi:hypothetical protein
LNALPHLTAPLLAEAFECCTRLYPQHAAFYYPRRYADKSGRFHSPLRLALSAVSASIAFRDGFTVNAQRDTVLMRHFLSCATWGASGCPILFPETRLIDALLLSDVPDSLVPGSLHLPHPGLAFALPRGAYPAEAGDLTHLVIAQTERSFRDPVSNSSLSCLGYLHFDGIGEDGTVYNLGIDPNQPLAQVHQEDFKQHSVVIDPDKGTLKSVYNSEPSADSCTRRILRLGLLLLLFLNTPHGVESAARPIVQTRPASVHKGKPRDALWSPNILTISQDPTHDRIPHEARPHAQGQTPARSLREHVRRGHFRVYRNDRFTRAKGNWQWIAPTWVGKGSQS